MTTAHRPVLLEEAISGLAIRPGGFYIDATFGRGGHSKAILERLDASGRLLVLDRDPQAYAVALALQADDPRLSAVQRPFSQLVAAIEETNSPARVDGLLFDLGVSSPQLDQAERGFSFQADGPLDMRMNPEAGESAAEWLRGAAEKDIADVLYRFGEERFSRRIARAIVTARQEAPIETTARLAEIVKKAHPAWERDRHPATKSFQAIRIKVNDELGEITQALGVATDLLVAGGRLAIISFHSLEDRIVKKYFAAQAKGDDYPRGLPITQSQLKPRLKKVGGAIKASSEELGSNPRARSAVLRIAEKLDQ